jgi:hypothetical protein
MIGKTNGAASGNSMLWVRLDVRRELPRTDDEDFIEARTDRVILTDVCVVLDFGS